MPVLCCEPVPLGAQDSIVLNNLQLQAVSTSVYRCKSTLQPASNHRTRGLEATRFMTSWSYITRDVQGPNTNQDRNSVVAAAATAVRAATAAAHLAPMTYTLFYVRYGMMPKELKDILSPYQIGKGYEHLLDTAGETEGKLRDVSGICDTRFVASAARVFRNFLLNFLKLHAQSVKDGLASALNPSKWIGPPVGLL